MAANSKAGPQLTHPRAGDGHAGYTEMATIVAISIASSIFLGYPQTLLGHGATAAWMIPILSLAPAALGWWAITSMLRLYPGLSLTVIYERVLGPWLGTAVNVAWVALWWLILGTTLREFADTVATAVLPTTPVSVISVMFMLTAAYAAFHGIEALSRSAWILLPWLLLPTIALLLATFAWWDFSHLTPLGGTGPGPLAVWGVLKSGNYGELALLGTIAPMIRRPQHVRPIGFKALFGAGAITVVMVLIYQLAWSVSSAIRTPFPFVKLARLAYLGRFVQRIEALFILVWVVVGVLIGAFAVYAISIAIAQMLRLPTYRPLLPAQGVLIFALMFLADQLVTARNFDAEVLRHILVLFTVGLPVAVYPIARWRARRAQRVEA